MSNKIKEQLESNEDNRNVIALSNYEFSYIGSITMLQRSVSAYFDSLKTEYLKILSVDKWNYPPEANLQFSLNLEDESHQLTVIELQQETRE